MRTNIEIDDKLMKQTMKRSGEATKKAAVEAAMRFYVRIKGQADARKLRGTLDWDGDLHEMRLSRFPDWDQ